MILRTIADNYLWFLVAILAVNLFQRKWAPRSNRKRVATLFIASLAMVWQIFIVVILSQEWPQWLAIVALFITVALAIPFRKKILLFKTKCPSCSKQLDWKTVLYFDDNLCTECWDRLHPEEKSEDEKEEEEVQLLPSDAKDVSEIDWDSWEPTENAVLCYLFEEDKVLLIEKKTGFGKGYTTAPGGHIEEDETASEAAIRETEEETGVVIPSVTYMGTLEFQFTDGLAMRGHVFFAHSYSGTPVETVEAKPFWASVNALPYDKMWADDRLWLPIALSGKEFLARFIFDGDDMLSHVIEEREKESL